jgi:hypothetical protein
LQLKLLKARFSALLSPCPKAKNELNLKVQSRFKQNKVATFTEKYPTFCNPQTLMEEININYKFAVVPRQAKALGIKS